MEGKTELNNIDDVIRQYLETIQDLMEKVMDLFEKRDELIENSQSKRV